MCATLCSMGARPTSTRAWFAGMSNLTRIEGLEYLNTSETTDMHAMFQDCSSLTTIYVGVKQRCQLRLMREELMREPQ